VNELLMTSCDLAREKRGFNSPHLSIEIAEIYCVRIRTKFRCNRLQKIIDDAAMVMDKTVINGVSESV